MGVVVCGYGGMAVAMRVAPAWGGWAGSVMMRVHLGTMVAFLLAQGFAIFKGVQFARRVRGAGWYMCFTCGYDLRAIESPGVCPECGRGFEKAKIVRRWREIFAQYPLTPRE